MGYVIVCLQHFSFHKSIMTWMHQVKIPFFHTSGRMLSSFMMTTAPTLKLG